MNGTTAIGFELRLSYRLLEKILKAFSPFDPIDIHEHQVLRKIWGHSHVGPIIFIEHDNDAFISDGYVEKVPNIVREIKIPIPYIFEVVVDKDSCLWNKDILRITEFICVWATEGDTLLAEKFGDRFHTNSIGKILKRVKGVR
jgi:hypothetical protein